MPCVIVFYKRVKVNWPHSLVIHCNILHIIKLKALNFGATHICVLWILYDCWILLFLAFICIS